MLRSLTNSLRETRPKYSIFTLRGLANSCRENIPRTTKNHQAALLFYHLYGNFYLGMAVSTLQSSKASGMKAILPYALMVVGLVVIFVIGSKVIDALVTTQAKSAIEVESLNNEAEVSIDNKFMGVTPFQNQDIKTGETTISLKAGDRVYSTNANFLPNNTVILKRDLGVSDLFSSGINMWFEKSPSNASISVVSEPAGATVSLDNTEQGKTPFSSGNITEGDYDLKIQYPGYEDQAIRIKVKKDFNLSVNVKLFPNTVPARAEAFEATSLYDLTNDNDLVTSDPTNWAKAVVYWNQTRGVNLSGLGINKELVFDYFVDYRGMAYNKQGLAVEQSNYGQLKDLQKGGYLGKKSDVAGLTDAAKATLEAIKTGSTAVIPSGAASATIKETPTGWLRVRQEPSLNGAEVGKVNTGEKYVVLENQTDWVKIKVSDTVTGWVSKAYVTITETQTPQTTPATTPAVTTGTTQ